MPEYRSPDEERATVAQRARILAVIDKAVRDATSVRLAIRLGEPPEVVERWVNTLWDGLRNNLRDDRPAVAGIRMEDRLAAIVELITDRVDAAADAEIRRLTDA